ncbi:MAG: RHS repeat-associated core domain-containing protein [Patescibacteria group bacterium]
MPRLTLSQYLNQEISPQQTGGFSSQSFGGPGQPTLYATYGYDAQGMRVYSHITNLATTTFAYPSFSQEGTATTTEHILSNGVAVATIVTGTTNPVVSWNAQDHLRSTSIVTNSSATITEEVEYTAFGSLNNDVGTTIERKKYTGHDHDSNALSYTYAKARYLNTDWGRFLSQDPESRDNPNQFLEDPQQLNTYSYARNNPLTFVDITGRITMLFSRPIGGLPGMVPVIGGAHTFIAVFPENPKTGSPFTLGGYTTGQDLFKAINGDYNYAFGDDKKGVTQVVVNPTNGLSVEEFDQKILQSYNALPNVITGDSYGFGGQIKITGNPNSNNVATDILLGAGVSKGAINSYQKQLYGNNLKFTAGLGQSAFSQSYIQQLSSILSSLQDALAKLLILQSSTN